MGPKKPVTFTINYRPKYKKGFTTNKNRFYITYDLVTENNSDNKLVPTVC